MVFHVPSTAVVENVTSGDGPVSWGISLPARLRPPALALVGEPLLEKTIGPMLEVQ